MLSEEIGTLTRGLSALRDLVDCVEPVLQQRMELSLTKKRQVKLVTTFVREKLSSCRSKEELDALPDDLRELLLADIAIDVTENGKDATGAKQVEYSISGPDLSQLTHVLEAAANVQRPQDMAALEKEAAVKAEQVGILYVSALQTLLSMVEAYLMKLLVGHYRRYPGKLDKENDSISWSELVGCESFDDAREMVIARRVERELAGGLEDWVKEFKRSTGVELNRLFGDLFDEMVEVSLRRNAHAHNGGTVNSFYLSRLPKSIGPAPDKGSALRIDRDYLFRAIDVVELGFVGLGLALWKLADSKDVQRAEFILNILYEDYVATGRWLVAEAIAKFALNDKVFTQNRRIVAQVNYWIALKEQGRFEEIRRDVEEADFSAYESVFRLGPACLLQDYEKAVKLIVPAIKAGGSFGWLDVFTWPLLAGLRKQERFHDLVTEHFPQIYSEVSTPRLESYLTDIGMDFFALENDLMKLEAAESDGCSVRDVD